ncbi:unnamed protein product [Candida verbasci]|uniref:Uncharacterized protein n=1 Tax=Candida verbasci TaxID=1227364 RepID=A0A9W4X9I7_9ASCO|nr:unnamed protein product [Candida verbasci]
MKPKIIYETEELYKLRHNGSYNIYLPDLYQSKSSSSNCQLSSLNNNNNNNYFVTQTNVYPISAYVFIHQSNIINSPPIVSSNDFNYSTPPSSTNLGQNQKQIQIQNQNYFINSSLNSQPIVIPVIKVKKGCKLPPGGLPLTSLIDSKRIQKESINDSYKSPISAQKEMNQDENKEGDQDIVISSATLTTTTNTTTSSDIIIKILPDD